MLNVGDRIRHFRELKGYSVNKLANLCGISQSYLREVELNNKNPTVEMLSIICEPLELSLVEFFSEDTELDAVFMDSPLIRSIYKLSPEQRDKLSIFINSLL